MDNLQIATIFEEIGNLLDIEGANRFRVLAYKNAAESFKSMGRELKELYQGDLKNLENLSGIGPDLRNKIVELLTTGLCTYHQELLLKYGRGLLDILKIRGIGPKKVGLFYKELGIDNLEKLKAAAENKQLSKLPRMGEKSETEILQALQEHAQYSRRMLISEALPLAEQIIAFLKPLPSIEQIEYAGSLRRRKETIGDLDILVAPKNIADANDIILAFQKFPLIKNVIAHGPTKSAAILENGVQVDLRVVESRSFGAALHYFTGSKDHNVNIRDLAKKAHKKINEYGIFDLQETPEGTKEIFIIGDTEENLYKSVGLSYIPPTLRENRGEFEASINSELPKLIETSDLHGDLNINSNYGRGKNTLTEIFTAALKNGLKYIAISDLLSSKQHLTAFSAHQLTNQIAEIKNLRKEFPTLKIYQGCKLSINADGSLDLPEDLIDQIDFFTITINENYNLPEGKQTDRLIKALSYPKIKLFSAPTARLLNERDGLSMNFEKILETCISKKILLEINGQPGQLDLPDHLIKPAHKKGVQLSINSDLTDIKQWGNHLQYGVWTAQRGWAEAKQIANTSKHLPL